MAARMNEWGQPIGGALSDGRPRSWPRREGLRGRFCRLEPLDAAAHAEALHSAFAQEPDARHWTHLP